MTMPSDSFCVYPWMHLFADEGGLMYPCCRSVGSKRPNVGDDGAPLHVQDADGIARGWNSAYMRTIRRDMLEGRRPVPCERCYMYDDLGMRSHRQDINDEYAGRVPEFVAATAADGSAPLDLRSVDLRLGNVCNLRCRMCSPQSSKALIGEFAAAARIPPTHHVFDAYRRMEWFVGDAFWDVFEKHTPHIERLHFAGGEPLIIPEMFDFLARLVRSGRAGGISLSYNTNLSVLPERVYELWPAFRSVRVTVSVDGAGPVNEFIRFPSDWSAIDRHIRALEADYDRLNLSGGLAFNTTVQIYNVLRLGDLLEYLVDTTTRAEAPNLSVLSSPRHLSIQALTPALKAEAAARLTDVMTRLEPRWPARWRGAELDALRASVAGIIEHMDEKDQTGVLREFRHWTAVQDQHRGQHTLECLPELAPLFEPASSREAAGGSVAR
ncbi:MAG: twitch domain-containing radical SAM protein [Vicinamibacterales bacterium]